MTNEEVKTSLDDATVTMKDIFKVLVEINTKLDILINKNNTVTIPYTPTPTCPSTPWNPSNPYYEITCETNTNVKDNIDKINHKPNIQTILGDSNESNL